MNKKLIIAMSCVASIGITTLPNAVAGPEGRCKACHSLGTANKVGPGLKGIFGKKAGQAEGFKYSKALAGADWVWDEENLRKWIKNSKKAIKEFTGDDKAKTKMGKQNIKGKKADKIIAFLKDLK